MSSGTYHITLDQLPETIQAILEEYNEETELKVQTVTREITKETKDIVKSGAMRYGWARYGRNIKFRTTLGFLQSEGVVYAGKHDVSLAHLLEKGHALWNTPTSARAFPHWIDGQNFVEKEYPTRLVKALER